MSDMTNVLNSIMLRETRRRNLKLTNRGGTTITRLRTMIIFENEHSRENKSLHNGNYVRERKPD